jgi:hypothetical protein
MAQTATLPSSSSAASASEAAQIHARDADAADFDIRALVREKLAASSDPDPHAIVEQVLSAIPRKSYREVIRYLLADAVRQWSAIERRAPVLDVSERSVGPSRWSRVASIFMDRIYLDGDDHRWEFLGKMTHDDLHTVAELRRTLAAGNIAAAVRFEKLAELLKERLVFTVEELDEAEVREVMAS